MERQWSMKRAHFGPHDDQDTSVFEQQFKWSFLDHCTEIISGQRTFNEFDSDETSNMVSIFRNHNLILFLRPHLEIFLDTLIQNKYRSVVDPKQKEKQFIEVLTQNKKRTTRKIIEV